MAYKVPKTLEACQAAFLKARKQYYNKGESELTDAEFDALEAHLRKVAPKWAPLKKTGIKVGKKVEVPLVLPMPSLDKLVAESPERVQAWVNKTRAKHGEHFVMMLKLDGSAVQAVYRSGKLTQLITRGDGVLGKDISFFIPHVSLPQTLKDKSPLRVIRLEAIMPLNVYNAKWSGEYDTARALASAVLNRQDVHPCLKDLHFVALRDLTATHLRLHLSLGVLKTLGFRVVKNASVRSSSLLEVEAMAECMTNWREKSTYESDGAVLFSDAVDLSVTAERPSYAKAFKINDSEGALETVIEDIVWKASAFNVLVPKAVIRPIEIGGATIRHAALHNARWALDRKAGIGATVRVLRSGDIIPKIVEVVKPAKLTQPDPAEYGTYQWNDTRTNLVLDAPSASVVQQKFARFFSKLDMEQMSGGLAGKLVQAGYTETHEIARLTAEEFAALPGIKTRAAVYGKAMQKVRDSGKTPIIQVMLASGVFPRGLGETRLLALQAAAPKLLKPDGGDDAQHLREEMLNFISELPGCGPSFAEGYVSSLPKFFEWLNESGIQPNYAKPKIPTVETTGNAFVGMFGTWTGYRSPEQEKAFQEGGGQVVPFGSKTTVLFYKADGKTSSKIEKAIERGVRATTWSDFENN